MYYRARYYDPYTGRFLQRDPLEEEVSNYFLKFKVHPYSECFLIYGDLPGG